MRKRIIACDYRDKHNVLLALEILQMRPEDFKVEEELDRVLTARTRRERLKSPTKVSENCVT